MPTSNSVPLVSISDCADNELFERAVISPSDDGEVGGSRMMSYISGIKGPNTEVEKLMNNYRSMMSLHERVRSRIHVAEHGTIGVASTMSTIEMLDAVVTQKSKEPHDLSYKTEHIQCTEGSPGSSVAMPLTGGDNVIDFVHMKQGEVQPLSLSVSKNAEETNTVQCAEKNSSQNSFTKFCDSDGKENCHYKVKPGTESFIKEEIPVETGAFSPRIKTYKSLNSQFDEILTENNEVSQAGIEKILIDANESARQKRSHYEKLIVSTGTPSTDAESVEPVGMYGDDIMQHPETPLSVRKVTAESSHQKLGSETEMISPGSFFLRYGIGSGSSELESERTIMPVASSCINYSNSSDHFWKNDSDCDVSLSSYQSTERAAKDCRNTEKRERRKSEPFGTRNGPITFIKSILCGHISTTPDWADIRSANTEDLLEFADENSEVFSSYSQSSYEDNGTFSTRSYADGLTRYESASTSCSQYLSVIPSEVGSHHQLSRCSTLTATSGDESSASTTGSKQSNNGASECGQDCASTYSSESEFDTRYESSYTYSYTDQDDTSSRNSMTAANQDRSRVSFW